jgi:hypothetical protein
MHSTFAASTVSVTPRAVDKKAGLSEFEKIAEAIPLFRVLNTR